MLTYPYELARTEHQRRIERAVARPPRRRGAPTVRVRRLAVALVGAVLAPLVFAGVSVASTLPFGVDGPPPAVDLPRVEVPRDPDRLTAVVVVGTTGAESFDVLAPSEVLATSGRFDVTTVAPTRRPLPLFAGTPELHAIDLLPHASLTDHDAEGSTPDLVVLPYIPDARDPANAPVLDWLRRQVDDGAMLLTICGGSWVAADAGLLDGRRATTHRNLFPTVEREHPDVTWVRGQRWVEDGDIISSAGIAAAVDASLRAVEKLAGRPTAERTAARLGYPGADLLDDPWVDVPAAGASVRVLNAGFRPDRGTLGVAVHEEVGELALASSLDLYPRSLANRVRAVGPGPGPVVTRHGITLAPRVHLGDAPSLDRLVIPGQPTEASARAFTDWGERHRVPTHRIHHGDGTPALDGTLADIARHESRATATFVAAGIEHPLSVATLPGRPYPTELLLRAASLVIAGGIVAWLVQRTRHRRRRTPCARP